MAAKPAPSQAAEAVALVSGTSFCAASSCGVLTLERCEGCDGAEALCTACAKFRQCATCEEAKRRCACIDPRFFDSAGADPLRRIERALDMLKLSTERCTFGDRFTEYTQGLHRQTIQIQVYNTIANCISVIRSEQAAR
jgi:hypothetical protein